MLGLLLFLPGGCKAGLFLGYGLPNNEACRDASILPGKPLAARCFDSFDARGR
jgi:hypothetical protein